MKMTFLLALAAVFAATPAMASEPATTGSAAAEKAPASQSRGADATARGLEARYPARPAEFRADGSISQYIGASHLVQTVVRIGADGKLEDLCTTDDKAARQFMEAKAASTEANTEASDAGQDR